MSHLSVVPPALPDIIPQPKSLASLGWKDFSAITPDQITPQSVIRVTSEEGEVYVFRHMPPGSYVDMQNTSKNAPLARIGRNDDGDIYLQIFTDGFPQKPLVLTSSAQSDHLVQEVFPGERLERRGDYSRFFGYPKGGFEVGQTLDLRQFGNLSSVRPCNIRRLEGVRIGRPYARENVEVLIQKFLREETRRLVHTILEKECTISESRYLHPNITTDREHETSLDTDVTKFAKNLFTSAKLAENGQHIFPYTPEELNEITRHISGYVDLYLDNNTSMVRVYECTFPVVTPESEVMYELYFAVDLGAGVVTNFSLKCVAPKKG